MAKKSFDSPYEKTRQLIYQLTGKRIKKKFDIWHNINPRMNTRTSLSTDRKLIGYILKGEGKENNKYLLTPQTEQDILSRLNFANLNELYWGNSEEIDSYFEELFVTLLQEMQTYKDYSKCWMGTPLTTKADIKEFYHLNKFDILVDKEIDDGRKESKKKNKYPSLKTRFIDFTKNRYEYFDMNNEVGFIKKSQVSEKDLDQILTFFELPNQIKIFADEVLFPFVGSLCLKNYLAIQNRSD